MSRKTKKKRAASKTVTENRGSPVDRDSISVWADNLIFSGVLLILFLRPFISGRTYPHYNHFFHMGVGVVTILWLLKCWRRGVLELHNRLLTGFVCAFPLVCSFTFFTTVNKGITLRTIYEIISYTLLFLVIANNFRKNSSIKTAVVIILSSALLINLYGLFQHYYSLEMTREHIRSVIESGNEEMLMKTPLGTGILHRLESVRVFSTFLYPNAYAMFLVIVGGLAVGWIWSMHDGMKNFAGACVENILSRNPTQKDASNRAPGANMIVRSLKGIGGLILILLFVLSCILIPWNLWLTYSRGGLVCAFVALLVFLVVKLWKRKVPREMVAAVILLAALLATALISPDAVSADAVAVRKVSFLERLGDILTVVQRVSYWKAALAMVRENPWLGVGWGAFEKAYPRYMILGGYPVKMAHNNYLQVWAETGTVGLNVFMGIWLVFFYTFWRKVRSDAAGDLRGIVCGLGAGVIGFLTQSLIDFALYLPALAYFVFALLGLLVAVPAGPDETDKFSFRLSKSAAAILIVLVFAYLWFLGRSYVGLNLYLRVEGERNEAFPTKFAQERGFEVDPEKQRKVLTESIPILKKSIKRFPLDADSHQMLGDTYLRLFATENASFLLGEAIKHFERATELAPLSPNAFQSLATAYWAMGNAARKAEMFQKALRAEQRASQNFPVNPEYQTKLAQMCNALGLKEQAQEHNRLATELGKHYKLY